MNTIRLAAVLVLTALFAAACSGGDDGAAPVNTVAPATDTADAESTTSTTTTTSTTSTTTSTTTTTTTSTTTAAPLSDEAQILDVIERYWQAIAVGFDPPEPNAELWADVATFENAVRRLERQQARLDAGEGVRNANPEGPFVLAGVVTSITDGEATAIVCVVDDAALYDIESGEVLATEALISQNRTELRFDGGRWLVDRSSQEAFFEVGEEDTCAAELAAL